MEQTRRANVTPRSGLRGEKGASVTTHRLDPTLDTTADVLSGDHAPVLGIDPGDTVVVRSLDASG